MTLYKLGALHKHASRTAAGVINTSFVRFQNLHQRADDAGRSIELTSILALKRSKLLKAVFVCAAKEVFLLSSIMHFNISEEVHHLAQTTLVQLWRAKFLGRMPFSRSFSRSMAASAASMVTPISGV